MSQRRMFEIKQPSWARGISWEWGKVAVLPFEVLRMNLSPAEIQQAERMGMVEEILDDKRPDTGITLVAPAIVPPISTPKKKKRGRPPKDAE